MRTPAVDVVFVDKGGVLVDNARARAQWPLIAREVLAERLGSRSVISLGVIRAAERRHETRMRSTPCAGGVTSFFRECGRRWLYDICDGAQIGRPPAGNADSIVRTVVDGVIQLLDAAFPDVVQPLEELHRSGVTLHTASGDESADLESYLRRLGLRHLFGRLYGPDLVDRFKSGPDFYTAITSDCGAHPGRAAVINDGERALDWAREVGLRTFHLDRDGNGSRRHPTFRTMREIVDSLL